MHWLTEKKILKLYNSIPEFARAAGLSPQSLYYILDHEDYGKTRRSRRTLERLKKLLEWKKSTLKSK
jgi:hypothetical protein